MKDFLDKIKTLNWGVLTTSPSIFSNRMLLNARMFTSRGSAFVLATLVVITQMFHSGLLIWRYSSIGNPTVNLLYTIVFAISLSAALLYFTLKNDDQNAKYKNAIYYFFIFDIFVNVAYYFSKFVWAAGMKTGKWSWDGVEYVDMIISIPLSFMLPFAIKMYGGEIRIMEKLDDVEDFSSYISSDKLTNERVKLSMEEAISNKIKEMFENGDGQIKAFFDKYIKTTSDANINDTIMNLTQMIETIKNDLSDLESSEAYSKILSDTNAIQNNVAGLQKTVIENSATIQTTVQSVSNIESTLQRLNNKFHNMRNATASSLRKDIDNILKEFDSFIRAGASVVFSIDKGDGTFVEQRVTIENDNTENQ